MAAEHLNEIWQREIKEQNERHVFAFIVAGSIGTFCYIGYDYLSVPALWLDLLWWRLLTVAGGAGLLVLFQRKRISVMTALTSFFLLATFYLGYFASLIDDRIQLAAWNLNLGGASFVLPLALLTFPFRLNAILVAAFTFNYLLWFFLNSIFSFYELVIYGGEFLIFVLLMSLFGHGAKAQAAKRMAELRFIIETKNQEILAQNRKLEFQATYDALTGAHNRGAGLQILEDRMRLNQRDAQNLTIVYIDVDNLKTTNDGLGHTSGDQLIRGVVEAIRSAIRDVDLVCRLGGDEFLLVMSDCDLDAANRIMNRISQQLEQRSKGSPFPYEISWGALSYNKDDFHSLNEFIEGADQLMYEAKQEKKQLQREAAAVIRG